VTAVLFAGKGWFVGAFDVNADGLAELSREIGADNCLTRRLDVTDKSDFESAVAAFGAETGGTMDMLFNNAGLAETGWFEDIPYEAALRIVQINLVGVLTGIYAALPLLKATTNSLCFSTCSASAIYGAPRLAVYAATKFAVKGLTEALSVEFSRHGVRVADTLPGFINTPLIRMPPRGAPGANSAGGTIEDNAPKSGPLRVIPPEDVADAVWSAYCGDKLHWYVPPELTWLERLKGIAPQTVRARIKRMASKALSIK
jgi:NAD(P)-dependent dehydrogenase (short-subunit alcohol dehydrogenase family)